MSDSARIIMTFKCDKACPGCANTYGSVMGKAQPLYSLKQLQGYKNLVVSGGEPMLYPDRVEKLARAIKRGVPGAKLFLYTAYYRDADAFNRIIDYFDGINYTVHKEANERDLKEFEEFQRDIRQYPMKDFRLYVDAAIGDKVRIDQDAWDRVKVAPWMTEPEMMAQGGCPEDLFYLGKPEQKHKVPPAGQRPPASQMFRRHKTIAERIRFCECCNTYRLEEVSDDQIDAENNFLDEKVFEFVERLVKNRRPLNDWLELIRNGNNYGVDKIFSKDEANELLMRYFENPNASYSPKEGDAWKQNMGMRKNIREVQLSTDDLFSKPTPSQNDENKKNYEILQGELANEQEYLKNDYDRYMECMNGKPLKDRKTPKEIRNGLILYWNVYRRIVDSED